MFLELLCDFKRAASENVDVFALKKRVSMPISTRIHQNFRLRHHRFDTVTVYPPPLIPDQGIIGGGAGGKTVTNSSDD